MHLHCIGINHRRVSVTLRERLAFSEEALKAALTRLRRGELQQSAVSEMVILSTCNRVEVYAVAPEYVFDALEAFLAETRTVSAAEFHPYLYHLADEKVVEHLLRVAAGLDSLVLGEPQILGQVIYALELARGQNAVGPVLSRLFQSAIHAGKRVRTETAIANNPTSIPSVAVRLAADIFTNLDTTQVVVLGAGEMAELVVEALRKRGVANFLVVNRTLEHARQLTTHWQGNIASFENLPAALESADILIASTGAPYALIHPPLVARVMANRPKRPLVMIDIAVPRDVDPGVQQISGVSVYDMDSLQEYQSKSMISRELQVPYAETILTEERAAFTEYLNTHELLPLISALRQQAELIRQIELEKTLRHLPDLSPAELKHIEGLTKALVNKILHAPTTRLRSEAGCEHAAEFTSVARSLFSLQINHNEPPPCHFASGTCNHNHSDDSLQTPAFNL